MLTVWRKLHIEVDTMEKWQGNKPSPDRVEVTGVSWQKNSPLGRSVLTLGANLPEGNNFYQGGIIKSGSTMLDIAGSTNNTITLFHSSQTPPTDAEYNAFIGQFELHDDDDRSTGFDLIDLVPRNDVINSFVKKAFASGYIEIEEIPHTPDLNKRPTLPFQINTPRLNIFSPLYGTQDMRGADRKEYWYHFVVMAYQYTNTSGLGNSDGGDGDPDTEIPIAEGGTIGGIITADISVIFLEHIRDLRQGSRDQSNFRSIVDGRVDHVVAHEIAHACGNGNEKDHAEEELMGGDALDDAFSAKTILRFRKTSRWQVQY